MSKHAEAKPPAPEAGSQPQRAAETPPGDAPDIVGIGASAGGLEALEQFLLNAPEDTGLAFVVVQHLGRDEPSLLVTLLARMTSMPVEQASDGLRVAANTVYVIPPDHDMTLSDGALQLTPMAMQRGVMAPIDRFLTSLALEQRSRAVGVILSGVGSDGTAGLRAIKQRGGLGLVQAADTAKFDGMPQSAIDAGAVDVVDDASALPQQLLALKCQGTAMPRTERLREVDSDELEQVFTLLRSQTGNDFSLYKKSTLFRRIERRMIQHQLNRVADYLTLLRDHPTEVQQLFRELLIGVTSFFRDAPAWEALRIHALPKLMADRPTGHMLRAWIPGCSTGEEAYSLAMLFRETVDALRPAPELALQIFATDLDREAIDKARQGLYPETIAQEVPPSRLERFFTREGHGYRMAKEVRDMVVFAPQNVIMDPPFTKLDVLACRNLLIYLSADLQKKLIPLFHYSLNPGGVLLLGSAETAASFSNLFAPLDSKTRLYRRLEPTMGIAPVDFPSSVVPPRDAGAEMPMDPSAPKALPPNLQYLADRVLVQHFAPVGVLCSERGDVLYISVRVGKYLEPAVGKANLNVFAMAREGLRYELSSAFAQALRTDTPVKVLGIKVGTNGAAQLMDLTVQKLTEPKELRGTVMVVLADAAATSPRRGGKSGRVAQPPHVAELERELQRAREEADTTRDQMQTSQEELKSTNEELQSTNEELQSTNEELTTSKEEMQSLNEELHTVNHELQEKVDELSRSNNDMKNLLNSTDIATLFLDAELNVRRFTNPTARIIKLIPTDAGRPITDISSDLDYDGLADDAREVLRTLVFKEAQASTRDGRWFVVRIMPYRTVDNVIDGVVITFTDVSAAQALETALREQANQLRQMAEALPNLAWGCRADGSCDYLSRQWTDYTGAPGHEQLGYAWLEQVHPDDRERVRTAWKTAVKAGTHFDMELRIRDAQGAHRWFKSRSVPIRDTQQQIMRWYGTHTDVDDLKRAEEDRRQSAERLAAALETIADGFVVLDMQGTVSTVNAAAERLLGLAREALVGRRLLEALPGLRESSFGRRLTEALESHKTPSFRGTADLGVRQIRFRVERTLYGHDGILVFFEQSGVDGASTP